MGTNQENKWPKAFVAIFGTCAISAAAYFLKEANVMWALILLYWIVTEM